VIHADCGFFTSSPNHYAVCGWRVAEGYWSKRRRIERAEARELRAELKRTQRLLDQAIRDRGPAPHRRAIKPRSLVMAGHVARWYVRGALAPHVDGDNAVRVADMTNQILDARKRLGFSDDEAIEIALAYARGVIHSPDPTPPPSPHPYGKAR
jgi:hypothetical protein